MNPQITQMNIQNNMTVSLCLLFCCVCVICEICGYFWSLTTLTRSNGEVLITLTSVLK